ncbi:asparagine synthase-related protein [Streptomyces sp. TRM70308]|uniref:asparagine synthase-related protein n=1 Tax=Streptomyces sp. TRM70308 TaxID=3131932 RepID=UPI003D011F34
MPQPTRRVLADALRSAAADRTDAPRLLSSWSDRQDVARVGGDTRGWGTLAESEYGIDIAAPFLDNEVVRACLAVPADQRGAPGRYKPLLAAAFPRGVLPPFVLGRTTKGGFNALSYAGLARHAPLLTDLLGPTSHLCELGLLTSQPVAAMLQRAATGRPAAQGAVHAAVTAEVWLRQQAQAAPWWQENERATVG